MRRLLSLSAVLTVSGCDCFSEAYRAYACRDAGACDGGGGGGAGGGSELDVTMGFSGFDIVPAGACTMGAASFNGEGSMLRDIEVEVSIDGGLTFADQQTCRDGGAQLTRFVAPALTPSVGFGYLPLQVGILTVVGTGTNDAGVSVRGSRTFVSRATELIFDPPVIVTDGGCADVSFQLVDARRNVLTAGSELRITLSSGSSVTFGLGTTCTSPSVELRWLKGEALVGEVRVGRGPGTTPEALLASPGTVGTQALVSGSATVWHGCIASGAECAASGCCSGTCDSGLCD